MSETKLATLELKSSIDMGDVLAIVTSRAETKLNEDLTVAKANLKSAEADLKKLKNDLKSKQDAETQAACDKLVKQMEPGVKAAGGCVAVKKFEGGFEKDGRLRRDVVVYNDTRKVTNYGSHATFTVKVDPSTMIKFLENSIETAEKDVEKKKDVAVEARKRLTSIPMLERKARARLAEAKLGESEDGQQILSVLTGELENDLLALTVA